MQFIDFVIIIIGTACHTFTRTYNVRKHPGDMHALRLIKNQNRYVYGYTT